MEKPIPTMMNSTISVKQKVDNFSKFELRYDNHIQSILINGKLMTDYGNQHFKDEVIKIVQELHTALKNGKKQKKFLTKLLQPLKESIENIEGINYLLIKFKDDSNGSNKTTTEAPINKALYQQFRNNEIDPEIYIHFDYHREKFNNYRSYIDFEKGLCHYIIELYKISLNTLYNYIYKLYSTAEFMDFKSYEFTNQYEFENIKTNQLFGCWNLTKKEIAQLFVIFVEENDLVFDENDMNKNRLLAKKFVEYNFKYKDAKNEWKTIETFNREYSEASSPSSDEVKKHKKFIDKLIKKLQNRKNRLKD